jgi:2,4-dienoyl-CoA reductase-like NADH-dependent reductase (Old Yellow Enzyme family)
VSALFSPYAIGNVHLSNRIVIPPMCQYSACEGMATHWHVLHLGNLALSGAGLLIIEATAVSPEGRITPWDLGLWSDETEAALGQTLNVVRAYSSMPLAIQLAHAGRKASTDRPWKGGAWVSTNEGGWLPLGPSPIPFNAGDPAPTALLTADIERIVEAFVASAERAHRLGIDIIELHAAHGYLLHEFLSPLSNHREDQYGGSLENRMRLPLRIFRELRDRLPERLPIGVRISASDWIEDGWNLEESTLFASALKDAGAAYIHVSSGGLSPLQKIPLESGYQVPFAEAIRKATGMPTIAVGLIQAPEAAEALVASGKADLVGIARGMIFDPRWPWHAAVALDTNIEIAAPYWRCVPGSQAHRFTPAPHP